MIEFPASGSTTAMNPQHEATGLIYVLEGKLRLDAGGMHEVLETGDCVCMESDMPLAWGAADKQRCRVLTVTPGGAN
jgi:quercetin dioxygenase-like cupin family protein